MRSMLLKHLRNGSLALGAALLPQLGQPEVAKAEIRFHAQICRPGICVEVGHRHAPRAKVRHHRRHRAPRPSHHAYTHVSAYDRQVASRLSDLSGLAPGQLLRWRRAGLSWYEVGRDFGLPRKMVKAALSPRAYRRYLARHGHGGDAYCWDG